MNVTLIPCEAEQYHFGFFITLVGKIESTPYYGLSAYNDSAYALIVLSQYFVYTGIGL